MNQNTEAAIKVEDWTKEQVYQWLTKDLKIQKSWADVLHEEEVSGKELVCYKPKDLCELGIKHGPAVRIIHTMNDLRKSQDYESSGTSDSKNNEVKLIPSEKIHEKATTGERQSKKKRKAKQLKQPSQENANSNTDGGNKSTKEMTSEEASGNSVTPRRNSKELTDKPENTLEQISKPAGKSTESKGPSNTQGTETQKKTIFSSHGEKLKNLLSPDFYDYYIIVTNKSHSEQIQHLQFLTTLNLLCVLDFDPDSLKNGLCHCYRKVRVANIHRPGQMNGDLKLQNSNFKQTSWVMCNGRVDTSDTPLPPSAWLKTRAGEVQDMISFLCNPDTLPRGRFLVIFLLLSVVEAMTDPIFDTFMSFYKNLGGTENILNLCTSKNAFEKWKDFTQEITDLDVNEQRIYQLELSEINGSI